MGVLAVGILAGAAVTLLAADVMSWVRVWNTAPVLVPRPRSLFPRALDLIDGIRELVQRRDPAMWEETCYSIAFHLRAGETPAQALRGVAEEGDTYAHRALRAVTRTYDSGASLQSALASQASSCPELAEMASVLEMAFANGGDITLLLCHTAEALRRRRLDRGELRSKLTEARATAILLSLLPWGIGAFTYSQDPRAAQAVLNDPTGRLLLTVAAVLWLAGNVAVALMLRALLPQRRTRRESAGVGRS